MFFAGNQINRFEGLSGDAFIGALPEKICRLARCLFAGFPQIYVFHIAGYL